MWMSWVCFSNLASCPRRRPVDREWLFLVLGPTTSASTGSRRANGVPLESERALGSRVARFLRKPAFPFSKARSRVSTNARIGAANVDALGRAGSRMRLSARAWRSSACCGGTNAQQFRRKSSGCKRCRGGGFLALLDVVSYRASELRFRPGSNRKWGRSRSRPPAPCLRAPPPRRGKGQSRGFRQPPETYRRVRGRGGTAPHDARLRPVRYESLPARSSGPSRA